MQLQFKQQLQLEPEESARAEILVPRKMHSIWKFYCHLLLLVLTFQQLKADCNVCTVTAKAACISENEYQQCTDGIPQGNVYPCNAGQLCSIHGTCEPESTIDEIACDNCEKCNSDKTFACMSTNTFALCLGKNETSEITGACGDSYVCNRDNPNICGKADEGFPATCSYTEDPTTQPPITTTTPSPETQPKEFCETIQKEGRFPVGTNPTTTCKQYIRCFKNSSDEWFGVVYLCPGATYFSSSNSACITQLPPRCSPTVKSLALYNLQLI